MTKKIAGVLSAFLVAFLILGTSLLRCSGFRTNVLSASPRPTTTTTTVEKATFAYAWPYPGKILPDSPLWPLKVARDRIWYWLTSNPDRKAELLLLFADKRLLASETLFAKDKSLLAFSTFQKAEKYLEQAVLAETANRKLGLNTDAFLKRLAQTLLAHHLKIEEIVKTAPEEVRPEMIKVGDLTQEAYRNLISVLQARGIPLPENP